MFVYICRYTICELEKKLDHMYDNETPMSYRSTCYVHELGHHLAAEKNTSCVKPVGHSQAY